MKLFLYLLFALATSAFAGPATVQESLNNFFGAYLVAPFAAVLFWDGILGIPLILVVLSGGGLFFTLRFGFVNVRFFRHAIDIIRGKFDNPNDKGEINHFKALTSALSATVGLGNIAGVAVAIAAGGPGAVFWMWVVAFFGMSMKFASCTLAQVYRRVKPNGKVLGGPMVFLSEGLIEKFPKAPWIGKAFGFFFAVSTIMASFGGGNLFQGNQTYALISKEISGGGELSPLTPWIVGIILSVFVSMVILGGIKRIGSVTSKMVPLMCGLYSLVCLIIVFSNFSQVPHMFAEIFSSAFAPDAMFGGFLGVLIQGMKRAAFSNEAGLGSAAIAHAAAKTGQPIREGFVAMIGPFIDTHVVCTMTALALLITGAHTQPDLDGVEMTAYAFHSLFDGLELFLTLAVIIFAYSTMISWSYYGERATEYLFGMKGITPYRIVYCLVVILGPVLSIGNVLDFADLMLLSMGFPNIIGMILLSSLIKDRLTTYTEKLKAGEFKVYS